MPPCFFLLSSTNRRGDRVTGHWEDDQLVGEGAILRPNGDQYGFGCFGLIVGMLVPPTYPSLPLSCSFLLRVVASRYQGEINAQERPNGTGTYTFANGALKVCGEPGRQQVMVIVVLNTPVVRT